ncbi:pyridoxal-phosphate dependent enzyme [Micromonospora sp. B11E3]|uniref:threonine ammonia-lyase n=1 Tax=Micromonospora sp. B11E3 TaxID=3153562 RepID=UPI00325E84D3
MSSDLPSHADLTDARRLLASIAHTTPLTPAPWDDGRGEAFLKLESLQRTGSYKLRGASVFVQRRVREGRASRGFVAASAGNHAQGLAIAAREAGVPATVVMPVHASPTKVHATRSLGARVELIGDNVVEAIAAAHDLAESDGLTLVPPFDSADVVAGQASVGLEILEQLPDAELIVVPVGGGGLLAGVGAALLHHRARTGHTPRLIGVQARGAASLIAAQQAGHPVSLPAVDTIADGIAVGRTGDLTYRWAEQLRHAGVLADLLTVDDDEIAATMLHLLDRGKILVEPAGAAAVAGVLSGRIPTGGAAVAVVSGGNLDLAQLPSLVTAHLARADRLHTLAMDLPDHPGALAGLVSLLAARKANIVDVHHDRISPLGARNTVRVQVSLQLEGPQHLTSVLGAMSDHGYAVSGLEPINNAQTGWHDDALRSTT